MVKYIHILLILSFLFTACSEKDIEIYKSDNYIYFSKVESNESNEFIYSFLSNPGEDETDLKFEVSIIGDAFSKDRKINYEVVKDNTTAAPENYVLPDFFVFRANHYKDTINVRIKKTEILKEEERQLVIKLINGDDFKVGPRDSLVYTIKMNNKISRPNWWNSTFESEFLGKYSDTKYELFMQVTGIGDFTDKSESYIRSYCLKFKYYLLEKSDSGDTVMDEDGNPMSVPIVG